MAFSSKRSLLMEYACLVLGIFLLAASVTVFFKPNHMVCGGFSGFSIIVEYYSAKWFGFAIPISVTNIALNLPLFIVAWLKLGKTTLGRTIFATVLYSAALEVLQLLPQYQGDLPLVAIYGGLLSGSGLGFVMRGYATTGGTDLLASIIHRFVPHLSVSKLLFVIDAAVIVMGFFVFGADKAMYAVIAVFISSKCISAILEGMNFSKVAFIISRESNTIAQRILVEADRGVTALHGTGMYTGEGRDVLFCVCAQKDVTVIKRIVHECDPLAFVVMTDAREVLGEGFLPIEKNI